MKHHQWDPIDVFPTTANDPCFDKDRSLLFIGQVSFSRIEVNLVSRFVYLIGEFVIIILLMEEIPHQLIGSLPHYWQCFIHPRWCRISYINSRFLMVGLCF